MPAADAPRPPCQAQRRDGQPCGGVAGPSGYCFAHDPELAARRKEGNRQGGQNKDTTRRLTKLVPSRLKPVLETLFTALDEVHAGDLEPRQATAMAALASAIGRLYETAQLEERLLKLEEGHREQTG